MTARIFRSAVLTAAFALLVVQGRTWSQEPRVPQRVLIDGFQRYDQHPFDGAIVVPDNSRMTLIRVSQPVYFDASRPRVVEFMQLQGQLAEFLSDEELEIETEKVRATLQVLATLHVMQGEDPGAIRQALRELIQSNPDAPVADAARRKLEQLETDDQPENRDLPTY